MNNNKRKIILGSIIGVLIGTLMSVSYAFFTYTNTGTNSTLVTGNIYMRYKETKELTLENAMPSDTYDETKKFEFTIEGANTTEDKDIWYEIKIKQGDAPTGTPARTNRIPDRFIKYKLVKEENNVEKVVVDGDSWEGLDTGKIIYVDKIEKNKPTVNHKYTLYMWISNKLEIGTSPTANFTIENWNKAFASIRVDVNGDFTEKTKDEPYQTVNTMNTFPTIITDQKANIKEVYFKKMDDSEMTSKYNAAPIKADLTYNNEGKVLAWLETNVTDSTKYTMYVASDGDTYLTIGKNLFAGWTNMNKIVFNNINTSRVSDMNGMFANNKSLIELDLTKFDTSMIRDMGSMFALDNNLETINMANLGGNNLNNVSGMFTNCTKIREINMSGFNFGVISDFSNYYSNLSNLEILNLSNAKVTNVTSMYSMFNGCTMLTIIDLSSFDTRNIATTGSYPGGYNIFNGCLSLNKIYVDSNKWDVSNQPSSMPIFGGNTNLVGQAPNGTTYAFDSSKVDKTMAVIATDTTPGYLTDVALKPAN